MEKIAKIITDMGFNIEEIEDNLNNTMCVIVKNGVGIGFLYDNKDFTLAIPSDDLNQEITKSIEKLSKYLTFMKNNSSLEQFKSSNDQIEFVLMKYMDNYITISLNEQSENEIYKTYVIDEFGEVHISEYGDEKIAIKQFIFDTKALNKDQLKVEVTLKSKIIDKSINILNNMKK